MARDTLELAFRFERAVADALSNLPSALVTPFETVHADFLLIADSNVGKARILVEVKLYTSRFPSRAILNSAIASLETAIVNAEADGGILATTFESGALASSVVEIPPTITVVGISDLLSFARDDPKTYSELLEISRAVKAMRHDFSEPVPEPTTEDTRLDELSSMFAVFAERGPGRPHPPVPPPEKPTGQRICEELDVIPPGKGMWTSADGVTQSASKHFEQKCEEAVRYIFEDQLESWDTQSGPDDGSHRYDLFAKIKSGDAAFWESLISDFRTRYVVFEFKNYGGKIHQNTVYVTEKYLFPTAMRSTAIIISREGADEGAIRAAKGALRDASKLIISLSREQVCELLRKRDAGEETQVYMAAILDGILRNIDR